jgi:hypothetical protein
VVALAQAVMVDETTYAAGTDHTAIPVAHRDRIRNPGAWVGGTPPALSALPYGKNRIKPSDLASATKARAALGLDTSARRWTPTAAVLTNVDRANAATGNNAGLLTSGRLQLAGGLVIPAGQTITTVSFMSGTQAAVTPTNQWACLVGIDRTVLVKSADVTTAAWAANTVKTFTLATPYTPTVDTPVYAGLVVAAGTVPDLRGLNSSTVIMELPPILTGYSTTGLTNPASLGATAAAITAAAANPFCYLA